MSGDSRWVPNPALSVLLLGLWLWLNDTLAPGQVLLGALLALAIPWVTREFWPGEARWPRPWPLLHFIAVFLLDVFLANLAVALLILGPRAALVPRFTALPIELDDELAITLLTSAISLAPGTVSADLSPDRRVVYVHSLTVEDEAALVYTLKTRYERPIREMFE